MSSYRTRLNEQAEYFVDMLKRALKKSDGEELDEKNVAAISEHL